MSETIQYLEVTRDSIANGEYVDALNALLGQDPLARTFSWAALDNILRSNTRLQVAMVQKQTDEGVVERAGGVILLTSLWTLAGRVDWVLDFVVEQGENRQLICSSLLAWAEGVSRDSRAESLTVVYRPYCAECPSLFEPYVRSGTAVFRRTWHSSDRQSV